MKKAEEFLVASYWNYTKYSKQDKQGNEGEEDDLQKKKDLYKDITEE